MDIMIMVNEPNMFSSKRRGGISVVVDEETVFIDGEVVPAEKVKFQQQTEPTKPGHAVRTIRICGIDPAHGARAIEYEATYFLSSMDSKLMEGEFAVAGTFTVLNEEACNEQPSAGLSSDELRNKITVTSAYGIVDDGHVLGFSFALTEPITIDLAFDVFWSKAPEHASPGDSTQLIGTIICGQGKTKFTTPASTRFGPLIVSDDLPKDNAPIHLLLKSSEGASRSIVDSFVYWHGEIEITHEAKPGLIEGIRKKGLRR
jgi:hypothetical protein